MKTFLILAGVFVLLLVYSSGQRRPSSWDSTRFGQRDWGRDRFGQDRGESDRGQNTFRSRRPDTTEPEQTQYDRGQNTFTNPRPGTTQPDQAQNGRGQNTFRSLRPDTTQPPAIVGHVPGRIGENRGFEQRGRPANGNPPPLPPVPQDQGQIGQRRETATGSRESSEVPSSVDEAFEMRQSGRSKGHGQSEVTSTAQPPARQVPASVEGNKISTPQNPRQQEEGRRTTLGSSGQVLPSPTAQPVVGQQLGSSNEISSSSQPSTSQAPPKVGQKEISTPQYASVDNDSRQQKEARRTTLGSSGQVLPSPTTQSVADQRPGQQLGSSNDISSSSQPSISQVPPKVGQKEISTPQYASVDKDSRQQKEGRQTTLGSSGHILPSPTPPSAVGQLGSSSEISSSFQPPIGQTQAKVGQRDKDRETNISQERGRGTPLSQIESSVQTAPSPLPQSRTGQQLGRSGTREGLASPQSPVDRSQGRKEQSNGGGSDQSAIQQANQQPRLGVRIEPQTQLEGPERKGSLTPLKASMDQGQSQKGSRQNKMPATPQLPGQMGISQTGGSQQRNVPKQLQTPISEVPNRLRQNEPVERRSQSGTVEQKSNAAPQSLPRSPTSQNSNKMREPEGRKPKNRQIFGQNSVPNTQQRGQGNGERGVLGNNGRGRGAELTSNASRLPRNITIQKRILS